MKVKVRKKRKKGKPCNRNKRPEYNRIENTFIVPWWEYLGLGKHL